MRLDGPLAGRHRLCLQGEHDPLLLPHGHGSDPNAWSRVVEALADRFRLLTYDLPGVGPLDLGDFDRAALPRSNWMTAS